MRIAGSLLLALVLVLTGTIGHAGVHDSAIDAPQGLMQITDAAAAMDHQGDHDEGASHSACSLCISGIEVTTGRMTATDTPKRDHHHVPFGQRDGPPQPPPRH